MKFLNIILLFFLNACGQVKSGDNLDNYLDFNTLSFNGESYSIGGIYSENDFNSEVNLKDNIGNCLTVFNPDDAISYTFYNKRLVGILVKYDNKNIYTREKIRNGMVEEELVKNYKGFKVEKRNSEGAGDSQQDFTYTVFDKDRKNNILIFDVVNGEIQGIHLNRKGFNISDCD